VDISAQLAITVVLFSKEVEMSCSEKNSTSTFCNVLWQAVVTLAVVCLLTVAATQSAQAQTFTVLHSFTGGSDGAYSAAGLTIDAAGNLYGTTGAGGYFGGNCAAYYGCGTVFQLVQKNSSWLITPIYSFQFGGDGATPLASVTIGPDGNLYGTTFAGGVYGGDCSLGCGTVFKLQPSAVVCKNAVCSWTETVLYRFQPVYDGFWPYAPVTFDPSGNLYGTTREGGVQYSCGCGTIYELSPSGGGWNERVIDSFAGFEASGAYEPTTGVILDRAGNLYGTAPGGPQYFAFGVIYELVRGEGGEQDIYTFQGPNDGAYPAGSLISDQAGNFYGATSSGHTPDTGATIYELSPSNGGWVYTVLYTWPVGEGGGWGSLTMDRGGNLYGASAGGAYGFGSIFKLTHSNSGWSYSSLHDFIGRDGWYPNGGLVIDTNGNLFGTTEEGGSYGDGVVFKIAP
jgi:uncharacterized repeat protein (TIGR03803 family)